MLKILETPQTADKYKQIISSLKAKATENEKTGPTSANTLAPNFAAFWTHPLVRIKQQRYFGALTPISYLSATSFSTVIIDLLTASMPATTNQTTISEQRLDYIRGLKESDAGQLIEIIKPMLSKSDTFKNFEKNLETWYDGYMEQVSGWYKHYTKTVVWIVVIAITLLFNIDTIKITNRIFSDKTLRDNLVVQADQTAHEKNLDGLHMSNKDPKFNTFLAKKSSALADSLAEGKTLTGSDSLLVRDAYVQYLQDRVESLDLPIGWTFPPKASFWQKVSYFFLTLCSWTGVGWLLTAAALSFGAPFWFDLLLKIVNIRNVTRKPLSSVQPS